VRIFHAARRCVLQISAGALAAALQRIQDSDDEFDDDEDLGGGYDADSICAYVSLPVAACSSHDFLGEISNTSLSL